MSTTNEVTQYVDKIYENNQQTSLLSKGVAKTEQVQAKFQMLQFQKWFQLYLLSVREVH